MATQIDSVSIEGMKQADFIQLQEMFEYVIGEGISWGREDYWDARNRRLAEWLCETIESTIGNKIKDNR